MKENRLKICIIRIASNKKTVWVRVLELADGSLKFSQCVVSISTKWDVHHHHEPCGELLQLQLQVSWTPAVLSSNYRPVQHTHTSQCWHKHTSLHHKFFPISATLSEHDVSILLIWIAISRTLSLSHFSVKILGSSLIHFILPGSRHWQAGWPG